MLFQLKIIIGSVVGFIATAIGVIAVFFPSLFNLEQKKIAEYSYDLNNLNDAKHLIDFLKNHQDSIVHLDITYRENERFRYARDKNGDFIPDDSDIDDGLLEHPKKEDLNEICVEGKDGYGAVDKDGYIFLKSEFKCIPFLHDFNFLRSKGEFGIWIPGKDKGGEDDKNYRIIITEASKNNSLFKWSIKDREKNNVDMQLSGTFFVNSFLDTHESDYGSDKDSEQTIDVFSPQWRAMYSGLDQIGKDNMTVIELEPLSKKEIESKKY